MYKSTLVPLFLYILPHLWQRERRKKNGDNTFTSDELKKLNDVGFVWDVSLFNFEKHLEALNNWKTQNGKNQVVPTKEKYTIEYENGEEETLNLGTWCNNNRAKTFSTAEAAEDFGVTGIVKKLCKKMEINVWKRRTKVRWAAARADTSTGWLEVTKVKNAKDGEEFEERYIYNGKKKSFIIVSRNAKYETCTNVHECK